MKAMTEMVLFKAIVGDYVYKLNCTTAPGLNGEAPYFYHGSTMAINLTQYTDQLNPTNSFLSVWAFPSSSSSTVFDSNVATAYGGAIYIGNSVNNVFFMPGTVFTDNTAAGSGGAVFVDSLSSKMYFYSTFFRNNASTNGGAVALQNLIPSVYFYNCLFTLNNAQYGGAVHLGTANGNDLSNTGLFNLIEFINATMRHNNAALDGGGIYANNLNSFSLVLSRMVDNVAGRSGGAMFLSQSNGPITIDSTIFGNNRASATGGAIALNTGNTLSISTSSNFDYNSAGTDGGAIFSNASNTITSVFGSIVAFSRNTCKGRGGALTMNAGSIVTFNGTTTFDSNYAQRQGGAIAVSASALVLGPSAITFINNSALSGSAMYLTSSSTSSVSLQIPIGSGCTNQTTCTTPPGYLSTGYVSKAYYDGGSGCNTSPASLFHIELGVCTNQFNGLFGVFGVYSLIPSATGGFPKLFFEQYSATTTGMK